jgi:hypothetical protein
MRNHEATVERYRASGKVDWGHFLPLALLVLVVATGLAFGLHFAYARGFYFVVLVPLLAAIILACFELLAITRGRCRSPGVGALLGLVAGVILYLGYYYIGMVSLLGPQSALKPQLFPRYLDLCMRTQAIGEERGPRGNQQGARPNFDVVILDNKLFLVNKGKNPAFNWFTFGFEHLFVLLATVGAGFIRARQPYCENCGRWKKQELGFLVRGQGKRVVSALDSGNLAEVAQMPAAVIKFRSAYTALAVEYCPSAEGQARSCPVYFSVKEVWRGGGLGQFQQFDVALGRMLIRRMVLNADETQALAAKFPSLASIAEIPIAISRDTGLPRPRLGIGLAEIQPVTPPYDRKIMTTQTLIIGIMLTLLPLLMFIGGSAGVGFGFYKWISSDDPNQKKPEDIPLYISMIGFGAVLGSAGGYLSLRNTTYLANRYLRSHARNEVRMRPDPLVNPDDPAAIFVEIVPRAHWGKAMLDTATDVGWILVDEVRHELLFEGDRERYRIPAGAILSCEVEQIAVGQGTSSPIITYATVIRVQCPSRTLEVPVLYRGDMGSLGANKRLKRAREFRDKIQSILPPAVEADFS